MGTGRVVVRRRGRRPGAQAADAAALPSCPCRRWPGRRSRSACAGSQRAVGFDDRPAGRDDMGQGRAQIGDGAWPMHGRQLGFQPQGGQQAPVRRFRAGRRRSSARISFQRPRGRLRYVSCKTLPSRGTAARVQVDEIVSGSSALVSPRRAPALAEPLEGVEEFMGADRDRPSRIPPRVAPRGSDPTIAKESGHRASSFRTERRVVRQEGRRGQDPQEQLAGGSPAACALRSAETVSVTNRRAPASRHQGQALPGTANSR
jgi:hypothetical protein